MRAEKPSRRISLWSRRTGDKIKTVAADTDYQLQSWLCNSGTLKPGKQPVFRKALFLCLDQPPLPNEYPKSAKDIRILAEQVGAGDLFRDYIRFARHREALIVIAAKVKPGAAIFATRISKLSSSLSASVLNKRGVSQQAIDDALMSPERTAKLCLVTRHNASWVHGRDQNPDTDRLQSSTVALIGCGSLGSTVAQQLADAGVGGFLLVDDDTLSVPNTARHFLGTEYLGHAKAAALAHALQRRHPRIRCAKSFSRPFQYTDDALMKEVFQSDLIIDCTGIWSCMASLHDLHKALEQKPALLTAWFEPHAVACLSVQLSPAGSELRAGFDPDGTQWSSVSTWPNPSRRWVSPDACAVLFSSYGASELAFHASHVAEHAIAILCDHNPHPAYISIGAADRLSAMGGLWSEGWVKANGGTEPGNRQLTSRWPLFDVVELDSA
ncbi:MAG: ThiF family adenylyltransferase [Pseudomonadota bacterium]